MDGLQAEEMGRDAQGSLNMHHQKSGMSESLNNIKTPRRGLGMIVNQSKTPCSQIREFSAPKSSVKHDNRSHFEVFEDASEEIEEPELKVYGKLEMFDADDDVVPTDLVAKKAEEIYEDIERISSPIEKVSRLSYGHDSLQLLHEEKLAELENVVLIDEKSTDDGSLVMTEKSAMAKLGVEEWDEYPPIERATRIENHDSYYDIEDLSHEYIDLINDQDYTGLNSSETEESSEIVRISYDDFDKWMAEQDEEDSDESFNITVDV